MSPTKRTRQEQQQSRDEIVKWAIRFCRDPEIQDSYESMRGTNSAAAPGNFVRLYEAVDDYRRPAQAKLRRYVEKLNREKAVQ